MSERSSDFQVRIRFSFLLGVGIICAVLMILFYSTYSVNYSRQQMYSLQQNYYQNYEGLSAMSQRMTELSRQLSTGSVLDLQQVFRNSTATSEDFEELTEYTDLLEFAMGDISIFYYINDSLPVVHSNGQHYRPMSEIYEEAWYGDLVGNNGRNIWIAFQADVYRPADMRFTLARYITSSKDYLSRIGILVIAMDTQSIEQTLVKLTENQLVYLEDSDGTVIASTGNALLEQQRLPDQYAKSVFSRYQVLRYGGTEYLVQRRELDNTGIYLTSVVPRSYVTDMLWGSLIWVIGCCVLLLLFSIAYINVMGRRLTIPLTQLTERISRAARQEDFREPIRIQTKEKEMLLLVDAYNRLIERISQLLAEQYRLGEEKKQAELMALQSQINPHFLYNTLDMVNWMAERGEKENVQEVILRMSQFYRLVLSKGRDIITLREELQLCESYLVIQQKRFQGRIRYEKDVEEELLDCKIPKITLQPLVENAILHGINKSESRRGTISIHGWSEGERMILAVLDDGAGLQQKDRGASGSGGSHYGMQNIQTRLSVFFQEEIHIEMESTPGEGTCVSINLPRKGESEE